MHKGKVLIGAPICQEPIILHCFFLSLKRLVIPGFEVYYHFIDDNHELQSKELLAGFAKEVNNVTIEKADNEAGKQIYRNHNWTQSKIWKVADFKDRIIARAREEEFDYLFFIDSDLLLYPQTVGHLIDTGKEIVSEVFWTKWTATSKEHPQVWLSDVYTQYEKALGEKISAEEMEIRKGAFFDKLRVPGLYEVGGLGACTLISKSAMEKGASFKLIKNLSFWGEDRHFCVRANALGIDLFVDTHYPAYHIFRMGELPGGLEFLAKTAE